MESRLAFVLVLGLAASLANLLGGLIVTTRRKIRRHVLNTLVALGAGFMLAAALLEVIPKSFDLNDSAPILILAGYLFVHLVEHTIATHFHFGEETHLDRVLGARAAYSALGGLILHTFFDGALIAAGFWISLRLGVLMFLAILSHKIPEGFTAASLILASGRSPRAATLATVAISVSTLGGVLSISFNQSLVWAALPFSAGVTFYVAASDLIPEVNKENGGAISIFVFLGVVLFVISDKFLGLALGV